MDAAARLTGYLDGQVDALCERGQAALATFHAGAVHKTRVASRKLSGALELLAPLVSRKPRKGMQKALRKIRHEMGGHRDLDVMLGHLGSLEKDARLAAGARVLALQLEHERGELREGTEVRVPALKQWAALRQELAEHEAGIEPVIAEAVHDRLDAAVRQAGELASPHRARAAFKELRYAVELAGETGAWDVGEIVGRLKLIQDVLGEWHDFAVLADRSLRLVRKGGLAFLADRDAQHLAELSLECLHKAQWKLGEFKAMWAEHGAWAEASVRATFPLARDAVGMAGEEDGGTGGGPDDRQDQGGPSVAAGALSSDGSINLAETDPSP